MNAAAPRHDGIKHLFLWPAFLIVLLIPLFPLIYALTVSFQSKRLVPPILPNFVGLGNYADVMTSGRFWGAIQTTATIVFLSVALQYIIGFAIALALHHSMPGAALNRVAFLLPMFLAPVCVALIARMGNQILPMEPDESRRLGGRASVGFAIRPEHMRDSETRTQLQLEPTFIEPLGAHSLILGRVGDEKVTAQVDPRFDVTVGQPCIVPIDMTQAHFFDPETELRL